MTNKKDITIFGFSRSLELFMISGISFIGLLVIESLVNPIDALVKAIFALAIGLSGVGTIYFAIRYNSEQTIAFMSANFIKIIEEYNNDDENEKVETNE